MALNNKKEEAERLRIQLDIEEALERQSKSLSSWREAQKGLVKNAKLLKVLSADIAALEEEAANATAKRKQEIDKEIASLKKQQAQLIAINKELSSMKTLLKAAGNSAVAAFKGILPSLSEIINKVLELDDITRKTAANIGMSGNAFQTMKAATEEARQSAIRWNQPLDYAVKAVASYNEETGRAVQLNAQQLDLIGRVALQTGMAAEEVAQMAGQMESFGLGASQAVQQIADIQAMSEHMGVNAGKVIKKFQQNLGMLNRFNFRGGMKALAGLAAHSEKFKLSMESVASVADKVFRPEGAIEASARLQTLGGSMSQLGDPFQLMYQARNAPEELAKSLTKAARESAVFNKKTGEFEMSAHELDRLREAADALGMDYQELVQTAKQAAKVDYLEKFLPRGMSEEEKGLIMGMTQMTKNGAEVTFSKDGKLVTKKLEDLSAEERAMIIKRAKDDEERAAQAKSLAGQWQSIQNGIMLIAIELLQPLVDYLSGNNQFVEGLKEGLIGFAKSIRDNWPAIKEAFTKFIGTIIWVGKYWKEILIVAAIAFAAYWIGQQVVAGMMFGKGFRMTAGVGGGAGGVGGVGGKGGAGGGMTGAQTAMQGQAAKASGMGSMMKSLGSAAQILAIAGALWILADALLKFNDVEWESLAKGGTALAGLAIGLYVMRPALQSFSDPKNFVGVAVLLALGGAMMMLGASAMLFAQGGAMGLIGMAVGLTALVIAVEALGATAPIGYIGAGVLLALGAAMMMLGAAVYFISAGIAMIVGSFTNLFAVVNMENIGAIMMLGPALVGVSMGIMALSVALVALGASMLMGGFLGLIGLADVGNTIKDAFDGVDADGIATAVNAVNSINVANIEALKSLSAWLAMASGNIKIEFGEIHVEGAIDLKGQNGAKANSELLNDPIFMRELKRLVAEHTDMDKKGGR